MLDGDKSTNKNKTKKVVQSVEGRKVQFLQGGQEGLC